MQSADTFAQAIGYPESPIDDLLVFHVVFGKSVPDVSLNAVANLGYAECRFLAPVYAGDTLSSFSEVIGLKENSNKQTGVVYVRTYGLNQRGERVLEFVRWVMVRKRDPAAEAPESSVPKLLDAVAVSGLGLGCPPIDPRKYDDALGGSPYRFEDYSAGERIDHVDGVTVEEAEHMIATRLYQNTAKVHFNQHSEGQGRFGRRLIYGGHVISLARALSFNGLAERLSCRGNQRRPARVAALRRRHRLRLEPDRGDGGASGARRRRGAARPDRCDQEQAVRRLSVAHRRRLRSQRAARPGLLGPHPQALDALTNRRRANRLRLDRTRRFARISLVLTAAFGLRLTRVAIHRSSDCRMSKAPSDPSQPYRNLAAGYTNSIRASDAKANIAILFVAFMMSPILGNYTRFPVYLPISFVLLPFLIVYLCLFLVLIPRYPTQRKP